MQGKVLPKGEGVETLDLIPDNNLDIKKTQNFERSHCQCIFNEFGGLFDIILKIMSRFL